MLSFKLKVFLNMWHSRKEHSNGCSKVWQGKKWTSCIFLGQHQITQQTYSW
jgi:hypothetical protein